MSAILRRLLPSVLGLVVGALVAWQAKPAPSPQYPDVVVPDQVLVDARPKAEPTVRTRIVYRKVRPTTTATSAGTPDTAMVDRFCAAALAAQADRRDTIRVAPDTGRLARARPILPTFSGRKRGKTLDLNATRSDGSLYAQRQRVRGDFEWVASDSTIVVREQRAPFRLFSGLPGKLLLVGAGIVVGKVVLH